MGSGNLRRVVHVMTPPRRGRRRLRPPLLAIRPASKVTTRPWAGSDIAAHTCGRAALVGLGTSSSWTGGAILSLDTGSPPQGFGGTFPGKLSLCSRRGPKVERLSTARRGTAAERITAVPGRPGTAHRVTKRGRSGSRDRAACAAAPSPAEPGGIGGSRHRRRRSSSSNRPVPATPGSTTTTLVSAGTPQQANTIGATSQKQPTTTKSGRQHKMVTTSSALDPSGGGTPLTLILQPGVPWRAERRDKCPSTCDNASR